MEKNFWTMHNGIVTATFNDHFPALKHYSSLNYKYVPSSPSIWQYVVSVKSTMKILSNFVAFLENTNFN